MKFYKRIFTTLLAVIMLLGAFSGLGINAFAAEGESEEKELSVEERTKNIYLGQSYNTPQEKLDSMTMMLERDGYQLWVDQLSGEVATLDLATGNIVFSNPYDVSGSDMDIAKETKKNGSESTQMQILSQLIVQYVDNGTTKYLYSFEEAALREQISVLTIKNGVRVEYTIGREESRKLVPRLISEENFVKYIETPLKTAVANGELTEFDYKKVIIGFYQEKSLEKERTKRAKDALLANYPICAEMDIYEFAPDATATEVNLVESYIKAYCEDYSFEQMDADHEETGYEATDEKYPVFKMALEYSLDNGALTVRMPCNGLRYDMTTYTLENISILPYFGAGNSKNPGYNFYPDGSGSLFDFGQLDTKATTTIKGKIYGSDYAYHNISGTYQKAIRYPVYGTVAEETLYTFSYEDTITGAIEEMTVSNTVLSLEEIQEWLEWEGPYKEINAEGEVVAEGLKRNKKDLIGEITETTYKRGYVAIIESGESLAEIATYHAGSLSPYNTMMNYFNPKPKDSYDIADAISVASNSVWTVVSERKYTGNIKIRYQMLSDTEIGEAAREADPTYKYYEPTWLGMAEVYRDYLIANGALTKKTAEDLEADIPLYIETFGAMETQQTIATIPMDVMTPLTTFEDISTMYKELSDAGVNNINFKMTGYANGGMYYTVPASLKWEKAVGGKDGLKDLIAQANAINANDDDKHLGLFPDFDFAYIQMNTLFDSTNLQKDAIKTIDNRYTSLRQYSATLQSYVSFYQLAVSPARYSKFYNKLITKYQEYGLNTMSVASLGTALNSDFDEDEPYNREDNKEYTVQAFSDLKNAGYSLMTDGGNAYTWGYVDHIINVDLDSSRYVKSSASVPFIGAVLHGYVEFAGTPFNEEGDTDYAILRAIENGAGLYFILSYQNTSELKEDFFLSQYYSVRYDIWREDVVAYYKQLNDLLKDVQTKVIVDHQFLEGERVLDKDELLNEIEQSLQDAIQAEMDKQAALNEAEIVAVGDAWQSALNAESDIEALIAAMETKNADILQNYNAVKNATLIGGDAYKNPVASSYNSKLTSFANTVLNIDSTNAPSKLDEEQTALVLTAIPELTQTVQDAVNSIKRKAAAVHKGYAEQQLLLEDVYAVIENLELAFEVIDKSNLTEDVKTNMKSYMQVCLSKAEAKADEAKALVDVQKVLTEEVNSLAVSLNTTIPGLKDGFPMGAEGTLLHPYVKDLFDNLTYFTEQDIMDSVILDEVVEEEEEEDIFNRYHVDNNQIVAVTYGDRDDATGVKTAYKTFILNYNTFAVVVEYNNVKYTIPSGGYIVLYN